ILRRRGAEEEQAEDRADVPRLDAGDRLHRRPACDLQQHAARDRNRHVRPNAEPLGPERRHRIEQRADDGNGDEPEAFMSSARRRADGGERAGHESKRRRNERERPREIDIRAHAHAMAIATAAATAVLMKFSMSLLRIPGPSSVAPSTLSTSAPTVAPTTTATIIAAWMWPSQ